MTYAQFPASRLAAAAQARLDVIERDHERRDANTERVDLLLAMAKAAPADGMMNVSVEDFRLLARYLAKEGTA